MCLSVPLPQASLHGGTRRRWVLPRQGCLSLAAQRDRPAHAGWARREGILDEVSTRHPREGVASRAIAVRAAWGACAGMPCSPR
jgi:hypothetical protein